MQIDTCIYVYMYVSMYLSVCICVYMCINARGGGGIIYVNFYAKHSPSPRVLETLLH